MSFGAPGGGAKVAKPVPPERGSFPLDHDGECKHLMTAYLTCLRAHRGTNDDECRQLSKGYLQCRMDRNLMAPDELKNLGYVDEDPGQRTRDQTNAVGESVAKEPGSKKGREG